MDSEYDRKFEEMKKYIPFLESMIKRLESTSSASANPRQAQLDKIRSLRDLLLDKKKRMKMENLLKCEQVLVNLYAKVERRESLTGVMKVKEDSVFAIDSPTPKERSELEAVRSKLKSVAMVQEGIQDKEFEIARPSEVEEVCTSGSKEPALFQRRPNVFSKSPSRLSPTKKTDEAAKSHVPKPKRNYTRVLVSPEPGSRPWSPTDNVDEKPLYSRRSPKKHSPTYHKKERRKSSKESHSKKTKGINITLNVPEESLSSLNTKDILPRIMNCRDGDVDIDTLRELRKQILGELKKTGANDDISDLILKSYNKKHRFKKKKEVEEGELSDSESEAIENIYGSLVVQEQNKPGVAEHSVDKDNRKIQICLVINNDNDQPNSEPNTTDKIPNPNQNIDVTDFEMYKKEEVKERLEKCDIVAIGDVSGNSQVAKQITEDQPKQDLQNFNKTRLEETQLEEKPNSQGEREISVPDRAEKAIETLSSDSVLLNKNIDLQKEPTNIIEGTPKDTDLRVVLDKPGITSNEPVSFKPNFYKPITEVDNSESVDEIKLTSSLDVAKNTPTVISKTPPVDIASIENNLQKMESSVEIPLLNEPTVAKKPDKSTVSEIDILQALKNEILSESIAIPGSEASSTPPLHQPKINKVASVKEILPKKRISIEKYKEKSTKPRPAKTYLFTNDSYVSKDDHLKKSKIKLTDKECERFNIPKISFDEESSDGDDIDKDDYSLGDIYGDLAPKSPDHEESSNMESTPPVIIPADPIKIVTVNHKADVDMRTLPMLPPTENILSPFGKLLSPSTDGSLEVAKNNRIEQNTTLNEYRPPLVDPRVRRDQQFSKESPAHSVNPDWTPRPMSVSSLHIGPNMTPNRTPILTPNARSYEMTPNHQLFDVDQDSRKHVYAPAFSALETHEVDTPRQAPHWELNDAKSNRRSRFEDARDRDPRSDSVQRDISQNVRYSRFDKREERPVSRADCPQTTTFGRSDPQMSPSLAPVPANPFIPFGRADCPPTPSHPFGRSECPTTPIHQFGRSEAPPTSSHMFNRMECPGTPMPSFGTTDCPPAPGNSFGRSDRPMTLSPFGITEHPRTPSHPFGRSEKVTTSHPFGRSEFNSKFNKDPRLQRKSELSAQYDEKRGNCYKSHKPYGGTHSYRNYEREQSVFKGDKYKYYADKSGRQFGRDQASQELGRSTPRDYNHDRYNRDRSSRYDKDDTSYEEVGTRRYQRERSIGRIVQPENNYRSTSRAPSVGRNPPKEPDKNFSVKRDSGRSFTIDTSVNTTFQKLIESGKGFQVFDYSFDARRQRAASVGRSLARESSVGRSLVRESSVGRTLSQGFKPSNDASEKRACFRRASSVGRDLAVTKKEKSFQEIKAEFEKYRSIIQRIDEANVKKQDGKSKTATGCNERSSKSDFEKRSQSSSNSSSYSPRKNYRDPRMRKNDMKDTRMVQNSRDPRRKSSGIDYSSDNIAKGTVLGSGTGVKNYKIPKIKRVVEEKIETIENTLEKHDTKQIDNKKESVKSKEPDKAKKLIKGKEKGNIVEKVIEKEKDRNEVDAIDKPTKKPIEVENSNSLENKLPKYSADVEKRKTDYTSLVEDAKLGFSAESNESTSVPEEQNERRITRSSAKGLTELKSPETSPIKVRTRKYKKTVIRDSESDSEKDSKTDNDLADKSTVTTEKTRSPVKVKNSNKSNEVDLDSSFGIDELEMFADNPGSDSVIDNINALIADLDNDIYSSKNDTEEDFTKDITLENMMENITSLENENSVSVDNVITPQDNTNIDNEVRDDTVQKQFLLHEGKQNINEDVTLSHDYNEKNIKAGETNSEKKIDEKCEKLESVDNLNKKGSNTSENLSIQLETVENINVKPVQEITQVLNKTINEDIVSTTHTEPYPTEDIVKLNEQNTDGISTPDSTIDTDEIIAEKSVKDDGVPDSTNEGHSEANVTSTDTLDSKDIEEPSSSQKLTTPALDSIGSLLSLLQDKSKIMEVLNMLGNQSNDNEKIKKKLEKLSEIMSEEDANTEAEKNEQPDIGKDDSSILNIDNSSIQSIDDSSSLLNVNESLGSNIDVKPAVIDNPMGDLKCPDEETEPILRIEGNLDPISAEHQEDKKLNEIPEPKESKSENIEADESDPEANAPLEEIRKTKKKFTKRSKFAKKNKGKQPAKGVSNEPKRVTRATVQTKPKIKKPSRELLMLQEDIKEMFIKEDILSSTGIRMCRLAKMVDDKTVPKENVESEPVVVLEKFKDLPDKKEGQEKVKRKKPGPKPKVKLVETSKSETNLPLPKPKPGPKSKTKVKKDEPDPYAFETDSVDTNTEKASENESDSDSESDSLISSQSFGSSESLTDFKKKPKRKRGGWQAGVIKPKKRKEDKKKKVELILPDPPQVSDEEKDIKIPDRNCFTDRSYCFRKSVSTYSCRLCLYSGDDIVNHYKKLHPHTEIPLSRVAPLPAKVAIEQCKDINFQAISKVPSEKYVCIFCSKEFGKRGKVTLENFFWHIVSTHTGEYKHSCTECVNVNQCPFILDIPSPPKDIEGQLIGYICKKCNFTQISLENLKTHVIVRHNDEQTAVHTINLSAMTKKTLNTLMRHCTAQEPPRVLRSCRSNQSLTEASDDNSDVAETSSHLSEAESAETPSSEPDTLLATKATMQSMITFETDDNNSETQNTNNEEMENSMPIKTEQAETEYVEETTQNYEPEASTHRITSETSEVGDVPIVEQPVQPSDDIMDYPHFKISFSDSGAKEYICCINQQDKHFKTTLLISMKKHVQFKHSENWDGYCFLCKVIVTPQGAHHFKDCLQHYLDKHMDNFPVLEKDVDAAKPPPAEQTPIPETPAPEVIEPPVESPVPVKPYINVRPLSDLISTDEESNFPKIESVVSLGTPTVVPPEPSPTYPVIRTEKPPQEKHYKYEEAQAVVMSNKHRVVLDTMMSRNKLIKVFKCAGRFCSFTTDSAEDALLHASTHQRIGGIDALSCSYCDFDAAGNAIDLVMHVFKSHGSCQYSCGQCFYRAAASQLVGAHMARVHASRMNEAVLRTTTATAPATQVNMLSREEAVQYYVCGHSENGENCKFRTYIPDKFSEHLQQRHGSATWYPCHICSVDTPSPHDLLVHMMSHGLKLYQCTWCVHGVDKESELLAHVSAVHPSKQPQAYLRIITNKDGSNELRVLPLAFLNKAKIYTEDVVPSGAKEDPVREAERSIELEKLIGHANLLIQATQAVESPPVDEPIATDNVPSPTRDNGDISTSPPQTAEAEIVSASIQPRVSQSPIPLRVPTAPPQMTPPRTATPLDISLRTTPVLKVEPAETPKKSDDVVILDSDEDEPAPPVIDLSDEELKSSQARFKKVPARLLNKCAKCSILCKTPAGLKKHFATCLALNVSPTLKCPHCSLICSKEELLAHYANDHREGNYVECGVCSLKFGNISNVKRHMKAVHNVNDVVVSSKSETQTIVRAREPKIYPKRKLSATTSEAPASKRRYLPQEVDQLPINPILDQLVYCCICEFSTKVRLNMVRHLQLHAEQQPVAQTAPVNPVPHLETNEKHFDKMVNLASSSIINRAPDKFRTDSEPTVALLIPPEAASRYPKYVPERQRLTCGAKGCSYISVDEGMMKYHWETLHSGTSEYHCVHCPPYQHLDTSKPLTAARVLAHLKMHDVTLFACSSCSYYHSKREALEKHLSEVHKSGKLMVVREEASAVPTTTPPQPSAAPTMDLKPWQCGLCKFKSMLRPEVIEHCGKTHQSKMQFKCGYCPFRTSAMDNITKHQNNAHQGRAEDVFYYYYREGSVPNGADGTPCWLKQRAKIGITETEIKTEAQVSPPPSPAVNSVTTASAPVTPSMSTASNQNACNPELSVDLSVVKQEVVDDSSPGAEMNVEALCKKYGELCEPNGLHFTCPLCKVVVEDSKEAMKCHLYEELKYRRWGCGLCPYKAFHNTGLNDHMASEHPRQHHTPIELPVNLNMEKWVAAQLDHQKTLIERNRSNFTKLKQTVSRKAPGPSNLRATPQESPSTDKYSTKDLEDAFGPFGDPKDKEFCCPKCKFVTKDEVTIKDHLESELTKIRWCCSKCPANFQNYHDAQFHIKSHPGEAARPKEAIRDPATRAAWVSNTIQTQRQTMKSTLPESTSPEKITPENENSLLVVRYEEKVTTPEYTMPVRRKRTAPESDDDTYEPVSKRPEVSCQFCDFKTRYPTALKGHLPKHFNLKPFRCGYCDFSSYRQGVVNHSERHHPGLPARVKYTEIPPELMALQPRKKTDEEVPKMICLCCEKSIPETETTMHFHDNVSPEFGRKGDVVIKCCICLALRIDVKSLQEHHNKSHPDIPINYALFKLHYDTRETQYCGHCQKGFKYIRDLKTHHNAVHGTLQLMYTSAPYSRHGYNEDKAKQDSPLYRSCARKSTTKLPHFKSVARKSTTKLPLEVVEEYSFYNSKRSSILDYGHVTTFMSFCNTMMPFTVKKLSEIIKIEPKVLVKDIKSDIVIDSSSEA